jgi:hypothetical protein
MRRLERIRYSIWGRLGLAAAGMWIFLPGSVLFAWPVLLWWLARILSRSTQPWFAAILAVVFGLQVGVLAQRPLGVDVLLLGGAVALLEILAPLGRGWQRWVGDVILGGIFCAAFLLAGDHLQFNNWLVQVGVLAAVNLWEAGATLWWRRSR